MKRNVTNLELNLWDVEDPSNVFGSLAKRYEYLITEADEDGMIVYIRSNRNPTARKTPRTPQEAIMFPPDDSDSELYNILYTALVWEEWGQGEGRFRPISFTEDDDSPILISLGWIIKHYLSNQFSKFQFIDNLSLQQFLHKIGAKQSWVLYKLNECGISTE